MKNTSVVRWPRNYPADPSAAARHALSLLLEIIAQLPTLEEKFVINLFCSSIRRDTITREDYGNV